MRKHNTLKKQRFSKRSKRSKKNQMTKKYRKSRKNQTKRIFFRNKKRSYQGGSCDAAKYPAVYGIDNRAVLYPISKYGITAGAVNPPELSNGSNGNGPYPGVLYGVYGGNGGGKKKKARKVRRSKYHGGGSQSTLFPQTLVNATRSLTGGVVEIANGFGGYTNSASLNPMPYNQPIDRDTQYLRTDFPNVAADYNKADGYVSTTF